jgi:hypothetical protein
MLLTHDLDLLTAAYLPGKGTHEFAPGITPDMQDIESWKPWIADSM